MPLPQQQADELREWAKDATEDQLSIYIANPIHPSALPFGWYGPVTKTPEQAECVALVQTEIRHRQERREHFKWKVTTLVAFAALAISAVQLMLGVAGMIFGYD